MSPTQTRGTNAEGVALGVAAAGFVFMLLTILGPTLTANAPAAEIPFGEVAGTAAPRLAPALPEPDHPVQDHSSREKGALTQSLVKGAKSILKVAESVLGPDDAGVAGAGTPDLQTIALVANLVMR